MTAEIPPGETPTCRICLCEEDDGPGPDDELVAPCKCAGSVKFVHRSCLDEWRRKSFNLAALTTCSTCKTDFRLRTPQPNAGGPQRDVWRTIARYLTKRLGGFFLMVVVMGFVCKWAFGDVIDDARMWANPVLDHLTLGTFSTLGLAGGVATLQLLMMVPATPTRWLWGGGSWSTGRRDKNDSAVLVLAVLLVVAGACWLLYHLGKGLWVLATNGRVVAATQLRQVNGALRDQAVRDYQVLNFDPADEAAAEERRRARQQRQPPPPPPPAAHPEPTEPLDPTDDSTFVAGAETDKFTPPGAAPAMPGLDQID